MSSLNQLETLGKEPKVKSVKDLPVFIRCLAALRTYAKEAKAKLEAKVLKLQKASTESLVLKVGDDEETVALLEHADVIEKSIVDFARDHHEELFPGRPNTWSNEAGKITTKTQPEKVAFIEAEAEEEELINKIIEDSDLLPEFDRLRDEFFEAFPYLRITLSLDKAAVLKGWQDKTLTAEDLESKGLKITREPAKYTVKPA